VRQSEKIQRPGSPSPPTEWVRALAITYTPKGANEMIKRFLKDETGLELSEYAVAAALIALATVTAFQLLGTNITGKITTLANTVK
jgi:pilus assembly protein Flp/PilA